MNAIEHGENLSVTLDPCFDVLDQPFPWWPLGLGLAFALLFALLVAGSTWHLRKVGRNGTSRRMDLFRVWLFRACLVFSAGWTLFMFFQTRRAFELAQSARRSESDSVVEGVVESLQPTGSAESVSVGGRTFLVRSHSGKPGYGTTTVNGGLLRRGTRVRIHYLDNMILKLEVAH
jgi:hypothetical protein